MKTIRYCLEDGIATITFDEPDSPVNTMCLQWQDDMSALAAQVLTDRDAIQGLLLTSAKSTFFAGADLKGVMRLQPSDAPRVFEEIERVKRNFRTLEALGKPVVSLLGGTALGGGWEVALVGHYRIAIDDPKTQFGLPEVTLGLLPGASGVTKMTRHLGLMGAQPYLIEGKTFTPSQAHQLGLVHELVAPGADAHAHMRARALAWIAAHSKAQHPWESKGYKVPGGLPSSPAVAQMLAVAPAVIRKNTRGLYPAPEAILACMVEGLQVDLDTALRIESRALARLMVGAQAKAMINTFFFNLNAIKSGQSRPPNVARRLPSKVGILGAGMMGAAIAYAQASKGMATVLKDVSLDKAEQGKAQAVRLCQARVDKGRMTGQQLAQIASRIQPSASAADLQGAQLIIEAVFENRDLKARVTQEAEPMLADGGVFASNTSTLPITGLARASRDARRFIGIHFFSPVDKMKLVEIIRGRETDDATVALAFDYVQALGKFPIVVNDGRGFFTSRVFATFVMEGIGMLGEGIPAPVIENAALQIGMPVGPLAVIDETSIALSVHVMDQTQADFAQEGRTYTPSTGEVIARRMVQEFQRPGRAAGGGFYDYPTQAGAKKTLWPQLKPLFERTDVGWELADIKDRLLYRQALETARCLEEGVLNHVHDGNIGSIFGIGFPAWTGGALQFIYGMGVSAFAHRCATLAHRFGAGFALHASTVQCLHQHQPRY